MHFEDEIDVIKLETEAVHLTDNSIYFPEEVWENVLGKVRNPDDIESCSNGSIYFWKLLEKKRQTKVVIPRVLQQLPRFIDKFESHDNNDNGTGDNETIGMKDFLKLRETCKSVNSAIENLHHSSVTGYSKSICFMDSFDNIHLELYANETFYPLELPQGFLNHFERTHYDPIARRLIKNPFLGRSVQFNHIIVGNFSDDEDQMYIHGIFETLEKYGAEIWYAYFDFWDTDGMNLVEIYICFVQFLKLLPNLKVLRVSCNRENFNEEENWEAADNYGRHLCLRRLRNEVTRCPIPELHQLEFLYTTDLPTKIFNELLQKNSDISKLQVERKERHSGYSIFKSRLPNLEALAVTFSSLKDFEKFESYRFYFGIEKFFFSYRCPVEILYWSRLFRAPERQLGKDCTELLIEMPSAETEYQSIQTFDDTHFGRLNLPNLEQITIECDSAISLDFLLPAKQSLETIWITCSNDHDDEFLLKRFAEYEEKQLVKFIGFKERMEDSNIWEEFPMLEDLTLFRTKAAGGNISYLVRRNAKGNIILDKERWYRKMA